MPSKPRFTRHLPRKSSLFGLMILLGTAAGLQAAPPSEPVVAFAKVPSEPIQELLDASLYDYTVFELETAALSRQVRSSGLLSLHLGNQTFHLTLELNDLRASGHRVVLMEDHGPRVLPPEPVATFRGEVEGDPASIVRLTVTPDIFEGYIRTAEEWLFIDSLLHYSPEEASSDVVVYRDWQVRPDPSRACGAAHVQRLAAKLSARAETRDATSRSQLRELEMATDGDGEFTQDHGASGAGARIETILNQVDGIFRLDLDLFIRITFKLLWSNPANDPYTTTDALTFRQQYADYWNANFFWVNRDANHLFTGKDLSAPGFGNGVIGVAFTGPQVCTNPNLAYSISEDRPSNFELTWIASHETGHILDARHDNQAPINCPGVNCGGTGPIMCSNLQGSGTNRFSSCSIDSVSSHVSNDDSCLD